MRFLSTEPIKALLAKLHFPRDEASIAESIKSIKAAAVLSGPNLWVLGIAILVASLGLNTNSTAVIIGAMLISPLMGPIVGFGLALGINDVALLKKAVRNFIIMVLLSVVVSTLYFFISPVKQAGSELLGRTSPTIYDVFIALFGGLAGILAGSSSLRQSNVIPGVAIATALMPPLCTVGYGLSQLNFQYAFGAFYLFAINSVFISLATYLVVSLLKYPKLQEKDARKHKRQNWIITIISILVIVPSVYFSYHIVKEYFSKQSAQTFLKKELQEKGQFIISSQFHYHQGKSRLELMMVGASYDSVELAQLQSKLQQYGLGGCKLEIFQGPDMHVAVKGEMDALNSNMQLQGLSIKDTYIKLDSLQRGLNRAVLPDSLQTKLARDLYAFDSSLLTFNLQRSFGFNPSKNKNDTMWIAVASFKSDSPTQKLPVISQWLKLKLNSPNVSLRIE